MKFADTFINRSQRFSIGREELSGRYYLSVPVSNSMVDYEEYYEISSQMYDAYPDNIQAMSEFADRCRARACDRLLFVQPGSDRGVG
jgi:hypothetical protein